MKYFMIVFSSILDCNRNTYFQKESENWAKLLQMPVMSSYSKQVNCLFIARSKVQVAMATMIDNYMYHTMLIRTMQQISIF